MRFLAPIFVGLLCMSGAGAQSYPDRPIKFVVGYAPGGSADFLTRLVAVEMAKEIGVHIVVENKPGAGGNIANAAVANSPPDGYTDGAVSPGLKATVGLLAISAAQVLSTPAGSWFGISAPRGTPADRIEALNAAANAALLEPGTILRLSELGASPMTGTPAEFSAFIHGETEKYARVIAASKIALMPTPTRSR